MLISDSEIIAIIEEETGTRVTPETTLAELGLDSLGTVDLLMKLEIPKEQYADIGTVGDLLKFSH